MISLKKAGITYRSGLGLVSAEHFVALSEIDLEVFSGETIGVIGRNGSGKSTLLRLLARIYQPDCGTAIYNTSRIPLLSLSLGFDPELSGEDNALLSSMLLGASLKQAKNCLHNIFEFSELGRFIEKPVKTYSSGMRARLGFSVALQMQTDVLLIDEALAVGDSEFRRKSEKAIIEKISSNQTVVLVSHSIPEIVRICDRALWLEAGKIMAIGDPALVTEKYSECTS
jgi:lipopolysaccharide transport system ATP-binding protein